MTETTRHRTIRERVIDSPEELAARKAACAEFRADLVKEGIKPKQFARLLGVSTMSGYRWVSSASHGCPPPAFARRFLWLLSNCAELKDKAIVCPIPYREAPGLDKELSDGK